MRGLAKDSPLRHIVDPAPGKGMAAQQAAQGKPAATQQAVTVYRDVGVLTAGGLEAATASEGPGEVQNAVKERREDILVCKKTPA
jgi:hypothetical protein